MLAYTVFPFITLVDLHVLEMDPQFYKLKNLIFIGTPRVNSSLRTDFMVTELMRLMYKTITYNLLVLLIVKMYLIPGMNLFPAQKIHSIFPSRQSNCNQKVTW